MAQEDENTRKFDNRRIALANATTLVAQGYDPRDSQGRGDVVDLANMMFKFLEGNDD